MIKIIKKKSRQPTSNQATSETNSEECLLSQTPNEVKNKLNQNLIQSKELVNKILAGKDNYNHMIGDCLCFKCSCGRHKCDQNHQKHSKGLITKEQKSTYQTNYNQQQNMHIKIPIRENWHHQGVQKIISMQSSKEDYQNHKKIDELQPIKKAINNSSQGLQINTSYNLQFQKLPLSKSDILTSIDTFKNPTNQNSMVSHYQQNYTNLKINDVSTAQKTKNLIKKSQINLYMQTQYKSLFLGQSGQKSIKMDNGMLKSSYQHTCISPMMGQSEHQRQFNNQQISCQAFNQKQLKL